MYRVKIYDRNHKLMFSMEHIERISYESRLISDICEVEGEQILKECFYHSRSYHFYGEGFSSHVDTKDMGFLDIIKE